MEVLCCLVPGFPFLFFSGQNDGFTLGILGACTAATLQLCGWGCIWNMASRGKRERKENPKWRLFSHSLFHRRPFLVLCPERQLCLLCSSVQGPSSVPHWLIKGEKKHRKLIPVITHSLSFGSALQSLCYWPFRVLR